MFLRISPVIKVDTRQAPAQGPRLGYEPRLRYRALGPSDADGGRATHY